MRSFRVMLLALVALAALLRLGALRSEFWFDEIWSWEFARAAASPWQVVAGEHQHHDNNHKLNTCFCGSIPPAWTGAGIACTRSRPGWPPWRWRRLIARRRGRVEAVFAALLFAANYWLVLCSTEARGYALAVCFALLAFYALQEYLRNAECRMQNAELKTTCFSFCILHSAFCIGLQGRRRMLVLFWVSVMLGFSAHLTFLHCYLALGLWSVYHGVAAVAYRREPRSAQLLACHLVPCLFVALLYVVDIRRMQLGGAPPTPTHLVLGRLLSLGLGFSPSTAGSIAAIVFAALALGLGLRLLARDNGQVWLFFAAVIVGSPALFLLGKASLSFRALFLDLFCLFYAAPQLRPRRPVAEFALGHRRRRRPGAGTLPAAASDKSRPSSAADAATSSTLWLTSIGSHCREK